MGSFWASRWDNYVRNVDWCNVVMTQCRPQNLIVILVGIIAVELGWIAIGAFEHWVHFWIAVSFGIMGVVSDFIVWRLRSSKKSLPVVIPAIVGVDGLFYGLCASMTALSVQSPYNYAMWSIYIVTLIYWGGLAGLSVICSLFLLSGPFCCLVAMDASVDEYALWGFGMLMYLVIAKNTECQIIKDKKRKAEANVRTANEVMDRYHRQLKVVHSLLSHDMKNKIYVMMVNAQILKDTLVDLSKDNKDSLTDIYNGAIDLNNVLQEFLASHHKTDESFRLAEMSGHISRLKFVRMDMNVPDVSVTGNPVHFMCVVTNLVDNAIEAGASNVKVSMRERGELVFVMVKDDGPGIPEDRKSELFSPVKSKKSNGTGMGLFLSQQLLKGYGGGLDLVDMSDDGAEFLITLAIAPYRG